MHRISKPRSIERNPWQDWIQRDDRTLLAELETQGFAINACRSSLYPWLDLIVTSVSFDGHSRWGVRPSKDETEKLCLDFIKWQHQHNEWNQYSSLFRLHEHGPWSLPLLCSRSYQRFYFELRQNSVKKTSAIKQDSENLWIDSVCEIFVESIGSLVNQFSDESMKLVFQLHLEGLLDNEISQLTSIAPEDVRRLNATAKTLIRGDQDESEYGT